MNKILIGLLALGSLHSYSSTGDNYMSKVMNTTCILEGAISSMNKDYQVLPHKLELKINLKETYVLKNRFLSKKKKLEVVKQEASMVSRDLEDILKLKQVKTDRKYEYHNHYNNGFHITNSSIVFKFKDLNQLQTKELFIRLGASESDVDLLNSDLKLKGFTSKEAYASYMHSSTPEAYGRTTYSLKHDLESEGTVFNLDINCLGE